MEKIITLGHLLTVLNIFEYPQQVTLEVCDLCDSLNQTYHFPTTIVISILPTLGASVGDVIVDYFFVGILSAPIIAKEIASRLKGSSELHIGRSSSCYSNNLPPRPGNISSLCLGSLGKVFF